MLCTYTSSKFFILLSKLNAFCDVLMVPTKCAK
jgi:hypothetical protein